MNIVQTLGLISVVATLGACSDGGSSGTPTPADGPPELSGISDVTVEANSEEQRIVFSVADDVTPAGSLSVVVEADNDGLFTEAGLVVGGSGEDRELVFTPARGATGTAQIMLTAQDAIGQTTTVAFAVNIRPQRVAFEATLRAAFNAAENDEPITLNDKELEQNEANFDDLVGN